MKHSHMTCLHEGLCSLLATNHEPYLSLFPSRRKSPLTAPIHGRMARLSVVVVVVVVVAEAVTEVTGLG